MARDRGAPGSHRCDLGPRPGPGRCSRTGPRRTVRRRRQPVRGRHRGPALVGGPQAGPPREQDRRHPAAGGHPPPPVPPPPGAGECVGRRLLRRSRGRGADRGVGRRDRVPGRGVPGLGGDSPTGGRRWDPDRAPAHRLRPQPPRRRLGKAAPPVPGRTRGEDRLRPPVPQLDHPRGRDRGRAALPGRRRPLRTGECHGTGTGHRRRIVQGHRRRAPPSHGDGGAGRRPAPGHGGRDGRRAGPRWTAGPARPAAVLGLLLRPPGAGRGGPLGADRRPG